MLPSRLNRTVLATRGATFAKPTSVYLRAASSVLGGGDRACFSMLSEKPVDRRLHQLLLPARMTNELHEASDGIAWRPKCRNGVFLKQSA